MNEINNSNAIFSRHFLLTYCVFSSSRPSDVVLRLVGPEELRSGGRSAGGLPAGLAPDVAREAYRLEDAAGASLPLIDSRVMPLAGRMNEVTFFAGPMK